MLKEVYFRSRMNEKVITVSEGEYNTMAGSLISTRYSNAMKQKFTLSMIGEDFMIKSQFNGYVMDVESGSKNEYAIANVRKSNEGISQVWRLRNDEKNSKLYYIENKNSGLVLEIEGGINEDGMRIVQNKNYGNYNQLWTIAEA